MPNHPHGDSHHSHPHSHGAAEARRHHHHFLKNNENFSKNTRKTLLVGFLTVVMTLVELTFGFLSSSMALLTEGWHMASHAGVMLITFSVYKLANSERANRAFSFGAGKFIPLGGYTNAIILAIIACMVGIESIERLFSPSPVKFDEAILVASVGLLVNLVSAFVLGHGNHFHGHSSHDNREHHHHHKADVNLKSAYMHILADTLTTVLTLIALIAGQIWNAPRLDALMGVLGSLVIVSWAYRLCRESIWELLDGHSKDVSPERIRSLVEDESTEIIDLHLWKIAPNVNACELVLATRNVRGTHHYRKKISANTAIQHLIIEEVVKD
jgi:cation diffusion facilitator family transporter